jgi:predicted RNA-binding protein with PUA-like domain
MMMPRYRDNWEAEYYDPISDAEDAEQEAMTAELDAEIMVEIDLCRLAEENEERNEALRLHWEIEKAVDAQFCDDYDDYDEDHAHWRDYSW